MKAKITCNKINQQLGNWCEKPRTAYKKVTLSQEKIDSLKELTFTLKA